MSSQFQGNDEAFAGYLTDSGTHGITLETLAAKGHYNIASVNGFENVLYKGGSLTTDQTLGQTPSDKPVQK